MTLDSSVMNVSIAPVAKDVGTTVTGIQGAITAYPLVMAALMITGAKVGAMLGAASAPAAGPPRRRSTPTATRGSTASAPRSRSALLDVVALYLGQRIPTTLPGHEKE